MEQFIEEVNDNKFNFFMVFMIAIFVGLFIAFLILNQTT